MPTAVEYSQEEENDLPAVQSNPGSPADFTGGVKPLAVWGLFLGGVFVVIIAVLFGPAGFLGGVFKALMGEDAWESMTCASVPAVQMGDDSAVPAVQMGDSGVEPGSALLPAVQIGDGGVEPAGIDPSEPSKIGGQEPPEPDKTGLNGPLFSFAMWLNTTRIGLGGPGFLPPNPCSAPPPPPGLEGDDPIPTDDPPVSTEVPTPPEDNGPHVPELDTCIAIVGDGVCSPCENTDLDSAACVCNMDNVCDPQEGLNCPDCQPTPIPAAEKPEKDRPDRSKDNGDEEYCPPGRTCP